MLNSPERIPRTLQGMKKTGYAIGTLSQMLPLALFNSFSFQFYVYTIGLDARLVSLGIFCGLLVYSVFSPIIGAISDNMKPRKLGKRRPLMILGLPFGMIATIMVWIPPKVPQEMLLDASTALYWPTAIYFILFSIMLNLSMITIGAPYLSMLPEQCQTQENQIEVAALQGVFNILGTVVALLFPMLLQSSLEDPKLPLWFESGELLVNTMPWIGVIFSILSLITFLFTILLIDESFLTEECSDAPIEKLTIQKTFKKMLEPIKNQKFRYFLGSIVSLNMGLRILMVVIVPLLTFVLLLVEMQFIIFALAITPFAFIGFIYWNKAAKKNGLIPTFTKSLFIIVISLISSQIFFIQMETVLRLLVGGVVFAITIGCLISGFLFPNPIVGSIVDEVASESKDMSKDEAIAKLSGSFFGLNLFSFNLASGIANLILGVIFQGDNATSATYILLSLPICALFYLISALFVRKINLEGNNVNL